MSIKLINFFLYFICRFEIVENGQRIEQNTQHSSSLLRYPEFGNILVVFALALSYHQHRSDMQTPQRIEFRFHRITQANDFALPSLQSCIR